MYEVLAPSLMAADTGNGGWGVVIAAVILVCIWCKK